jgi:hypothetical protein
MKTNEIVAFFSTLPFCVALVSAAPGDYVAHEWGTFTSVQGADGVQTPWNPLITSDLPKFVHDVRSWMKDSELLVAKFATGETMPSKLCASILPV